MDSYEQKNMNSAVSWIALIVSVAALVLGWAAYNRAGEDLEDQAAQAVDKVEAEVDEFGRNAAQVAARAEARTKLAAIEAKVAVDQSYAASAAEIDALQADVARAYEGAEGEAKEEAAELDREFATLSQQMRNGTADSLTGLANLLNRLSADARN